MVAMVSSRTEDERVVLNDVDWDRFEMLLTVRGDRSQPRVAYLDGVIELMSPSLDHERIKSRIGCLLETYLYELGIMFETFGSWLVKQRSGAAGAEPDECYLIGDVPRLPAPTHPDLAIEVVWTSGGIDKLEIYRRLQVPEVWFWIDGAIVVHVLTRAGYVQQPRSRCLPALDLELLCHLLELPTPNEGIRELRAALARQH